MYTGSLISIFIAIVLITLMCVDDAKETKKHDELLKWLANGQPYPNPIMKNRAYRKRYKR